MQSNARFHYLFRRYIEKSYTPAEKEEFMNCLQQPEYDALLRELLRKASGGDMPLYEQAPGKADAIFSAITGTEQERPFASIRWLQYAAAALIVVATGLGGYYFLRPGPKPVVAAKTYNGRAPAHSYIILPDGSKVLLNSNSHLHYPPAFNIHSRDVYLEGEAWFDIRQDTRTPFIVHTGKVKTVVLGTAFDIKAPRGQENVVVTVTRGKVRVEKDNKTLAVLTRNEQITVDDKTAAPVKQLVTTEEVMNWKAQDVLFDDTPVSDVAADLEKRFSVHIQLENPDLGNCRVTASFLHHETPEEIVQVLSRINHMQYRIDNDNNIILSGEGCR